MGGGGGGGSASRGKYNPFKNSSYLRFDEFYEFFDDLHNWDE